MLEPNGRTVMISGASRGLGNAIARRLHADGYNVSCGARDREALIESLAGCEGAQLLCHYYDATQPGRDRRWVDATIEHFGQLDGLVNNAGILDETPFEDLTDEIMDEIWAVNVKGPLRLTQCALPHLRASGAGRIVNLASLSGVRVKGTFAPAYSMTKHAVMALTESTKNVAWDDGVRVTALCPGFIATDMTAGFGEDPGTMIQPADLAELVSTVMALPNTASVATLQVGCRLEPGI